MGKSQRTKGARLEREVVLLLHPVFPDAERNPRQSAFTDGRDVVNTPGFCFQVKGGKRPPWQRAYDEAKGEADTNELPVAVTKTDRQPWMVHLTLVDFLALLRGVKGETR